jgi:hypothetical protein
VYFEKYTTFVEEVFCRKQNKNWADKFSPTVETDGDELLELIILNFV